VPMKSKSRKEIIIIIIINLDIRLQKEGVENSQVRRGQAVGREIKDELSIAGKTEWNKR
jgi:hypothetical protein